MLYTGARRFGGWTTEREGEQTRLSISTPPQNAPSAGDTTWFTHGRFGRFIHWGIYSAATRQIVLLEGVLVDAHHRCQYSVLQITRPC
ncbi:MAG: hypothetical protein ACRDJW_24335 [Thermomicrobiales bacterium]